MQRMNIVKENGKAAKAHEGKYGQMYLRQSEDRSKQYSIKAKECLRQQARDFKQDEEEVTPLP